jgi:hypothetical protein
MSDQAPAVVGIAALAVDCADPHPEGNEFCFRRPRS